MNESLVRAWSVAYSDEVLDWAQPPTVSNMEVFADVYHSLIHSPVSATLLQVDWSILTQVHHCAMFCSISWNTRTLQLWSPCVEKETQRWPTWTPSTAGP